MKERPPAPDIAAIEALAGHRFPGGEYRVEHWENALLTGCTGAELLPAGQVHPVVLFHLPIQGAGTSIAELFALGQAESDLSITIESYDWEMFRPIHEERTYRVNGCITSAQRIPLENDQAYDRIQFRFEVMDADDTLTASSTLTWHYTRNML